MERSPETKVLRPLRLGSARDMIVAMFARYFVELPLTAEAVEHALALDPRGWLPGLAADANHRGEVLLAEVGFGERIRLRREVGIVVGAPVRSSSTTVFPVRWEPTDHTSLFPALDADLEVAPLGSGTQLAMSARYEPPFGGLGRTIDRALLSRVAEATVKDFLDHVAEAIMRAFRDGGEAVPLGKTHGPGATINT